MNTGNILESQKNQKYDLEYLVLWEPSFYSMIYYGITTIEYPFKVNIFSLDLSIAPLLSFKLSKKLRIEFKLIPSILAFDLGRAINTSPIIFFDEQFGERNYALPQINWGSSIQLKYLFKEPDRRSRR